MEQKQLVMIGIKRKGSKRFSIRTTIKKEELSGNEVELPIQLNTCSCGCEQSSKHPGFKKTIHDYPSNESGK